MTPRDKAIVGGLITVVCVASIPLLFLFTGGDPVAQKDTAAGAATFDGTPSSPHAPPLHPPSSAATDGLGPRDVSAAFAPADSGPSAAATFESAPAPPLPPRLGLASPRETVDTQRRLLDARDDDAFRKTFMPAVQSDLTAEAIESCRKRLVGKTVKPDWEVAETTTEPAEGGAHKVVRVSMFGKSMTGFHEVAPDRWLADAAWCMPSW